MIDLGQGKRKESYSQGVNHGFEAHVHLPTANDFSDIGGVVRLQDGNFNALVCEIALRLREKERGMVGRCVPCRSSLQLSSLFI